jgi:hypothetical protein
VGDFINSNCAKLPVGESFLCALDAVENRQVDILSFVTGNHVRRVETELFAVPVEGFLRGEPFCDGDEEFERVTKNDNFGVGDR